MCDLNLVSLKTPHLFALSHVPPIPQAFNLTVVAFFSFILLVFSLASCFLLHLRLGDLFVHLQRNSLFSPPRFPNTSLNSTLTFEALAFHRDTCLMAKQITAFCGLPSNQV
jgi:hypothetical protein